MPDAIRLLDEGLIEEHTDLAIEVLAASTRLQVPLGWHYLLDLIWILRELDVAPPATVLDAGAGWGVLQFLLADRGYRVISADMVLRHTECRFDRLYHFETFGEQEKIEHTYLDHLGERLGPLSALDLRGTVEALMRTPLGDIPGRIRKRLLPSTPEKRAPGDRPTVSLYRCDLGDMAALADHSIDAVVSVSALEHNPPEGVRRIVRELDRVTRPGGLQLLTVSACREGQRFHEQSHSHLLGEAGLRETYGLREVTSNFARFDEIEAGLRRSRFLRRWLASFYYDSGANGMPWGVWDPAYVPVGLRRTIGA